MPEERKNQQCGTEGDQIERGHTADRVMNVAHGALQGGNAEQMERERGAGKKPGADKSDAGKQSQNCHVAQVWDADLARCYALRLEEGTKERRGDLLRIGCWQCRQGAELFCGHGEFLRRRGGGQHERRPVFFIRGEREGTAWIQNTQAWKFWNWRCEAGRLRG